MKYKHETCKKTSRNMFININTLLTYVYQSRRISTYFQQIENEFINQCLHMYMFWISVGSLNSNSGKPLGSLQIRPQPPSPSPCRSQASLAGAASYAAARRWPQHQWAEKHSEKHSWVSWESSGQNKRTSITCVLEGLGSIYTPEHFNILVGTFNFRKSSA